MAVKTRAQLKSENAADFPDNVAHLIAPADLRGQMDDIVDSALFPEDGIIGEPGPPGADSGSVDGMAALRAQTPVAGKTLRLNYHTTPGDLGAGQFVGVTSGGPYLDDGGTVCVGADTSKAWLRVWDGQTAHVGWFGAKCDLTTDDYIPVKKCLGLFTNGRTAIKTGAVDVGPGFAFGTPLVIGGNVSYGIRIFGHQSHARGGLEKTTLWYTGPAVIGAIYLYGCNGSTLEMVNVHPGLALNNIILTADNGYNLTLTAPVTAGASVVVTPSSMTGLQRGCFLGVDAGGDNFEIVYVTKTTVTTFTATFTKNHAAGVQVGGGSPSSGMKFNHCQLLCAPSPIWTTITGAPPGGPDTVFTPASMVGIEVGMPLRIGSGPLAETVYVKSVTSSTFTGDCNQTRVAGVRCMYATSAVLIGNLMTGTVQVSEMQFSDVLFQCSDAPGGISKSYAGMRQIQGGNCKNITCTNITYSFLHIVWALEASSGQLVINGAVGAGVQDTIIYATTTLSVFGLEDESQCYWLLGSSGANPVHGVFTGCTFQGRSLTDNDEVVVYLGQLTFIACWLQNSRDFGVSLPRLVVLYLRGENGPGALTLINCQIYGAQYTSSFISDGSADGGSFVDVVATGNGKVAIINCIGGIGGDLKYLPTIMPAFHRFQNTATYDPPSLLANTAGTAQTMSVPGAVLGDLVDVSFSQNLGEMLLRAWVSAVDTVSYQFRNPTASPIDLASGTVKCRVKK